MQCLDFAPSRALEFSTRTRPWRRKAGGETEAELGLRRMGGFPFLGPPAT